MEAPCGGRDAECDGEPLSIGSTLADEHDSPYDYAAHAETREKVEAALRQVPEVFRTVVILREIEGFTYEEIAEILGVNLGTVKSRLTRGRAALRDILIPRAKPTTRHTQSAHARPMEVSR